MGPDHEMSYGGHPLPALRAQNKEDTAMRRACAAAEMFAEKEFYLDEFHDRSLLVALRTADWSVEPARPAVVEVLTTLLRNDSRLVLLLETDGGIGESRRVTALANQLARGGHTLL